jgi:predicted transcriptional regulator
VVQVSVRYKEVVMRIVYSHGCATRKEILELVYSTLRERLEGRSRKYLEFVVDRALKRLVERGVVVRKNHGVYCKP